MTSSEEVLLASTQSSLDDPLQRPIELVLELDALRHGLDDQLAVGERLKVLGRVQPLGGVCCLLLAQLAAGGFFAQPVASLLEALLQGLGDRVEEQASRAPERQASWAIPAPIVPAPRTPMIWAAAAPELRWPAVLSGCWATVSIPPVRRGSSR